jgi:hypothetical protein
MSGQYVKIDGFSGLHEIPTTIVKAESFHWVL